MQRYTQPRSWSSLYGQNQANDSVDSMSASLSRMSVAPSSGISLCVVCLRKPPLMRAGTNIPRYAGPTCGLHCASVFADRGTTVVATPSPLRQSTLVMPGSGPKCVVCDERPAYKDRVTCGLRCADRLAQGEGDPNQCSYCRRKPKMGGRLPNFCSSSCAEASKIACLYCRARPRNGRFHLCGRTCKKLAMKRTPLLLEVPVGHDTFTMVEQKFKSSWRDTTKSTPKVQRVFKVVESKEFLQPYVDYREVKGGNESYVYHGTKSVCSLGQVDYTGRAHSAVCGSSACGICGILKTSFNVAKSDRARAFGAAVYTSTAANKAYNYCNFQGTKTLLLNKVILGRIKQVNGFAEVKSCPPGFDSVMFDRHDGDLNETVVYNNDAIRPVFLLVF